MSISRLEIADFRNLQQVAIAPHPKKNFIFGSNGSGKTSILEAIFFLSRGRSFRATRARQIISFGSSCFSVFAAIDSAINVGIRKESSGSSEVRLNGMSRPLLAEVTRILPTMLLSPTANDLFNEGSSSRRAQLDWGVFHVEQDFFQAWRRYKRALEQRNSLLKLDGTSELEAASWSEEMAGSASLIHRCRAHYFERWLPYWNASITKLLPKIPMSLEYSPGWDTDFHLLDVLRRQWISDISRGFTQSGPHKADLRVKIDGTPAEEFLSGGQRKLLACALKLSQLLLLEGTGICGVLLIDDLSSELDEKSLASVLEVISSVNSQTFITAIDPVPLSNLFDGEKEKKMFHVEQGRVQERPL